MIGLHDIDCVADPLASILVVPVFDAGSNRLLTTYPNTYRAVGDDTASKFADVVAVDLLGSAFHFFPSDLVQVPMTYFTRIVHWPVCGTAPHCTVEDVA